MATYNSVDLGYIQSFTTAPNAHARQVTAYPGVNGLEILNLGSRGSTTSVSGAVSASSLANLSSALQTLGAYVSDGGAYTLVDNLGTTWTNVVMMGFTPVGKVFVSTPGIYTIRYEAQFLHIG